MYKKLLENNYDKFLDIFNCINVGIYITDGNGKTLFLNDESCKTGGLTREDVIGRNMQELESIGFIENSISLKVIQSGHEESIIQNLGDGNKIYVTGTPLYIDSKINIIICTERDITETLTLKKTLKEKEATDILSKNEAEYLRNQNIVLWGSMIAEDIETKQSAEKAKRIAKLDTTILLTGESGTGKEVFANFIYQNSSRLGKAFIKVNCAAIPDNLLESELFGYEAGSFTGANKNGKLGLFEMANGGTLFLDEIGEIPIHLQSKLLRAIQEKEIMHIGGNKKIPLDIRLITATNKDLQTAVNEGTFRKDLYYRLNIVPIELHPLRGRFKDIQALAFYFIERFNKSYHLNKRITDDAMKTLQNFNWPGNIRELENIIERIMISFDGNIITKFQIDHAIGLPLTHNHIPHSNVNEQTLTELLEEYEKNILIYMAEKYTTAHDISNILKINKSTLSRRLKKYDIKLKPESKIKSR